LTKCFDARLLFDSTGKRLKRAKDIKRRGGDGNRIGRTKDREREEREREKEGRKETDK
jgi:hypothetical protein